MLYRNQGVFNLFLSIAALKEAASSKMIPDEQKLIEAIEEIEGSRYSYDRELRQNESEIQKAIVLILVAIVCQILASFMS